MRFVFARGRRAAIFAKTAMMCCVASVYSSREVKIKLEDLLGIFGIRLERHLGIEMHIFEVGQ